MASRNRDTSLFAPLGVLGPLIVSCISILALVIVAYVLIQIGGMEWHTVHVEHDVITTVGQFLFDNVRLFFVVFLLSNYTDYFLKYNEDVDFWVRPLTNAVFGVITLWIIVSLLERIIVDIEIEIIHDVVGVLDLLYVPVFLIVLGAGYVHAYFVRYRDGER
ncbi:MAG TPA: hypothetical protein ENN11_04150 [Methanomicrobia archaeon]|nr:hypothetical protein [Methanomicrobia archaeon]